MSTNQMCPYRREARIWLCTGLSRDDAVRLTERYVGAGLHREDVDDGRATRLSIEQEPLLKAIVLHWSPRRSHLQKYTWEFFGDNDTVQASSSTMT